MPSKTTRHPKKPRTAAQKKLQSEKMKAYWASRRDDKPKSVVDIIQEKIKGAELKMNAEFDRVSGWTVESKPLSKRERDLKAARDEGFMQGEKHATHLNAAKMQVLEQRANVQAHNIRVVNMIGQMVDAVVRMVNFATAEGGMSLMIPSETGGRQDSLRGNFVSKAAERYNETKISEVNRHGL